MTEQEDTATENHELVLVPLRNRKRLQKDELFSPSHSTISLSHVGPIGRPQLLSCMYAACGCDENQMFGSSKNKCCKCEEITNALGKYISRETLEIKPQNTIQCKPLNNVSVSVDSVVLSCSENLSKEFQLQSGMVLSFLTNFESEKQCQDKTGLSFEVVHCPRRMIVPENSSREEKQDDSTNKRPLEPAAASALPPRKSMKHSRPNQGESSCIDGDETPSPHQPLSQLPVPVARSSTPRSSSCTDEKKESKPQDLASSASPQQVNSELLAKSEKGSDLKVETKMGENEPNKVDRPFGKQSPETKSSRKRFQPRLFFLPLGQDMAKGLISHLLTKVKKLGVIVVDKLDLASHMIVSPSIDSWERVATRLKMNETELLLFLSSKNIKAITLRWVRAMVAEGAIRKPAKSETWMLVTTPRSERKQRSDSPSRDDEKKKKREFATNMEVSKIFKELGELYQDCPLEENDTWRAYGFRINAGRVKLLPFELNLENLERLQKDVIGFGDSCIEIVRQHLEGGQIERIHNLKTDKRRTAMRNMMEIWGVGKHAALRLINDGCNSIEDVRRKLMNKTLGPSLDKNQLVGVDCYEDIMERMSRPEVEQIGEIIKTHVLKLFPGAEVTVMGSYRRGKKDCGDVDVHITSNDYRTKIPQYALGSILDSLWRDGHIAFHLTFLHGMETGNELRDYQQAGKNIPPHAWEIDKPVWVPKRAKGEKTHSTYMGVFNSPMIKGKRRRVDLKFYPYRERIFAAVYFTGNGFFNRSMRLWARQKGWQLNDSGLFNRGTTERILEATEERHVFDMLGLVYKDPQERDSFDALEPKTGELVDFEPTKGEFKEFQESKWVE